jgi:hypothetical protein
VARVLAAALGTLLLAAGASGGAVRQPGPLRGTELGERSGLRLLVASNPPFVLDVDSGRSVPLADAPLGMEVGVLSVVPVGGRAAAVIASSRPRIYAVRAGRAVSLGDGEHAVAAADGRSVWIVDGSDQACTIRRVGLDGRQLRRPRAFPCAGTLAPGGAAGLVVGRTRVVSPATGRTVRRTRLGVVAAAGRTLVLAGPRRSLTLLDAVTGRQRRIRWPSVVRGLDAPAVDPRGRYVALGFADPVWNLTGAQVEDVWVLDARTSRLTHLPSTPVFLSLKATSMDWTADGRLVLLGEDDRGAFVAVWRPGAKALAVKRVRLPQRTSGSDTFAVID